MHRSICKITCLVVAAFAITACGPAAYSESTAVATPTVSSPAGSPTRSASPNTAPLPAALVYTWVGETRSIPSLAPPAVESFMKLDRSRMQFFASEDWNSPIVTSLASAAGPDEVRFRLENDSVGCNAGDEGIYGYALSPTGRALTVHAVADPCGPRIAAVSGSWAQIGCPDNHTCLGDLDAGTHVSTIYTPFVRFSDWHYDYGRFAYTVPEGWSNPEDNQDGYVLTPADGSEGAGLYVFSDVLAHRQGLDPTTHYCTAAPAPGVGGSATAIHDWIRSLPGLQIANDRRISIGGLAGFEVDVSMDRKWTRNCGWEDAPMVPLFVNAQTTPDEGFDWGLVSDGRMRLFILSLGPDRTLVIDIEAQDEATWDALVDEATPIVRSFEFRH